VIVITIFLPNSPGVIQDIGNVTHAALIANAKVMIESERTDAGEIEKFAAPENGNMDTKPTRAVASSKQ